MALYTCDDSSGLLYSTTSCGSACPPETCQVSYTMDREWRNDNGHILISYAATATGKYSVSVMLGSTESAQLLVTVPDRQVSSTSLDLTSTEAAGNVLTGAEAGAIATFMIRATDRFGNRVCSTEGCPPVPLPQLDLQAGLVHFGRGHAEFLPDDSIFICRYNSTLASTLTLSVSIYRQNLGESPYSIRIRPSAASATDVQLSLPPLFQTGMFNRVSLHLRDRFKNQLEVGGDEVKMRLDDMSSGTSTYANINDWLNGSYLASFNSTSLGKRWLTVLVGIEPGFSTEIELFASRVHAASCSLLRTFRSDLRAGSEVLLQVAMRDFLSNPIFLCTPAAYGEGIVNLTISRTDWGDVMSPPATVLSCENGMLTTNLKLTTAGEYICI